MNIKQLKFKKNQIGSLAVSSQGSDDCKYEIKLEQLNSSYEYTFNEVLKS